MDTLVNANVAYLALMVGILLATLALFVPGTGLIEIAALFVLLLAGWEVYNLLSQINYIALIILILGVIPFVMAVRTSGKIIYLLLTILALVVGSTFLFRGEQWWQPGVDPILALVGSTVSGLFLWVTTRKSMEAVLSPPSHLRKYIGATGKATTDIQDEGTVQLKSELWSARSEELIPSGSDVRVVGREGFILLVEPVNHQSTKETE